MPARIYARAKELNVDSKDLVDLVKKVGITGKGSALASLTDEEAQKVRDHLASANQVAPEPKEEVAPGAVRDVVPSGRKPISIRGRKAADKVEEAASEEVNVETVTEPVDLPTAGTETSEPTSTNPPSAPEKGTGVLASRIKSLVLPTRQTRSFQSVQIRRPAAERCDHLAEARVLLTNEEAMRVNPRNASLELL